MGNTAGTLSSRKPSEACRSQSHPVSLARKMSERLGQVVPKSVEQSWCDPEGDTPCQGHRDESRIHPHIDCSRINVQPQRA